MTELGRRVTGRGPPRWPLRVLSLRVLVVALGLLAWPALAVAHEAKHEQHEERLPTIGAAPDFALTSQDGAEVTTVEGLATGDQLHPV